MTTAFKSENGRKNLEPPFLPLLNDCDLGGSLRGNKELASNSHQTNLPLLRWAGGKASIADQLISLMPREIGTYFEPFLGGGAVFFRLSTAKRLVGSDSNWQLMEFYTQVRDDPEAVLTNLAQFSNTKECFLRVRKWDRKREEFLDRPPAERAARFFFLNRTCFNGLYRENSRGEFNVPYGGLKNPRIFARDQILSASMLLRREKDHFRQYELVTSSYRNVIAEAGELDFVYFDPPYVPLSKTASFVAYQSSGFTHADQLTLRDTALALSERGVKVMISNSDTDISRELYRDSDVFFTKSINKRRNIGAASSTRVLAKELIVTNYPADV